jgi:hypothetical protein
MTKAETLPILFVPDTRLRLKARPIGDADGDKGRHRNQHRGTALQTPVRIERQRSKRKG